MLRQATQNLITALYPRLSPRMNLQVIPYRTKKDTRNLCKTNGFTNLRWYTDDGIPARQRPGFQAMLADMKPGK